MHRGARARGDERKMSSSDLMGSRGSGSSWASFLQVGCFFRSIAAARCGRAWRPWGRPYYDREARARSSSWRVARALGRLYCTSVRGRVLRTFVRDFCDYCVSCNYTARNMCVSMCLVSGNFPAQLNRATLDLLVRLLLHGRSVGSTQAGSVDRGGGGHLDTGRGGGTTHRSVVGKAV